MYAVHLLPAAYTFMRCAPVRCVRVLLCTDTCTTDALLSRGICDVSTRASMRATCFALGTALCTVVSIHHQIVQHRYSKGLTMAALILSTGKPKMMGETTTSGLETRMRSHAKR